MILHIDFETRSTLDLREVGLHNYARHHTTDVWLARYTFGGDHIQEWRPHLYFADIAEHVLAGGIVCGYNVKFELEIWNNILVPRYGWPPLSFRQCRDTMLMALTMAHPPDLDRAVKAARLLVTKDMDGHRLMMRMCKPRRTDPDGTVIWWDDDERQERLSAYCAQDVRAEIALHDYADDLSQSEQEIALIDHEINERGVYIDRPLAEAALEMAAQAKDRLDREMRDLTDHWVRGVTDAAGLGRWLRQRGIETDSVAKGVVAELLKTLTDSKARRALELRQQGAKSSTAKIQRMLAQAGADNRIRHTMQHNAAGTGRWGGRVIQPHNLPRPEILKNDEAIEEAVLYVRTGDIDSIEDTFGAPLVVLADLLRSMICAPPGKELIVGDWASIEGRGLAWLAGESWKVKAYSDFDAGIGEEIYKLTASNILGKTVAEITGSDRQAFGKVPELALGYQGGVGAFDAMAAGYGVNMAEHHDTVVARAPDNDQEWAEYAYSKYGARFDMPKPAWIASEIVKIGWRRKHPAIREYWAALEEAALSAMREPRSIHGAGPKDHRRVYFRKLGNHLYMRLPSGRKLCYPWAEIREIRTPWGGEREAVTYETLNQKGQWVRVSAYGGLWAENVTQAMCADILRHALRTFRASPYEVVMHVHDELVSEVPIGTGSTEKFRKLICRQPEWAKGLPLAAQVWRGMRFKKD